MLVGGASFAAVTSVSDVIMMVNMLVLKLLSCHQTVHCKIVGRLELTYCTVTLNVKVVMAKMTSMKVGMILVGVVMTTTMYDLVHWGQT
jgi:hypothetical protein